MEITRDEVLEYSDHLEVDKAMPDSTTPDSTPNASPARKKSAKGSLTRSVANYIGS